mgnify:CR=1 FL=1
MDKLKGLNGNAEKFVLRSDQQEDIVLQGELCVGRDLDCDIHIADHRISRQHARISLTVKGILVEDLSSSNGTFINGQKVLKPVFIKPGDLLSFHNLEFRMVNISTADSAGLVLRSEQQDDIALNGNLYVGRDAGCEVHISNQFISRKHARISVTSTNILLEDLNSTNGTFINGQRIEQPTLIKLGDYLRFNELEFRIERNFDPEVTYFCGAEIDPDGTLYGGDIIQRPQISTANKKGSVGEKKQKVPRATVSSIEPEVPVLEVNDNLIVRLSAIQKQQRNFRNITSEQQ